MFNFFKIIKRENLMYIWKTSLLFSERSSNVKHYTLLQLLIVKNRNQQEFFFPVAIKVRVISSCTSC